MKKLTLLEKAKARIIPVNRMIGHEEIELTFAWLRGEVTVTQVCDAVGKSVAGSNAYALFALALRKAYQDGRVILKQ